jgi:hypothetical protein
VEFTVVNNKFLYGFYSQDFFNVPPLSWYPRRPIIVYMKSRLGADVPGWDFYDNVTGMPMLNGYDIIEASKFLRKQKLIQIGL